LILKTPFFDPKPLGTFLVRFLFNLPH